MAINEFEDSLDFSNISRNFIKQFGLGCSTAYVLNYEISQQMAIDPVLNAPRRIGVAIDKLYYSYVDINKIIEDIGVPGKMYTRKAFLYHFNILEKLGIIKRRYSFYSKIRAKIMFVALNPNLLVQMTGLNYRCKVGIEEEIKRWTNFILCCQNGYGPTGEKYNIPPYLKQEEKNEWNYILELLSGNKLY